MIRIQVPQEGHEYVVLAGGPLAGLLLDVTAIASAECGDGAALITQAGALGPGGRAPYGPRPEQPEVRE